MFEEPRDALYLLQRWYLGQCDDEWEHARRNDHDA